VQIELIVAHVVIIVADAVIIVADVVIFGSSSFLVHLKEIRLQQKLQLNK